MKRAALAILITLAGCQTVPIPTSTPTTLTEPQVAAMKVGLAGSLKDPDSARFGNYRAGTDSQGAIIVCGWLNAKNSFGGYTGDQPYMGGFRGDLFTPIAIGGDELDQHSILQVCAKAGLSI